LARWQKVIVCIIIAALLAPHCASAQVHRLHKPVPHQPVATDTASVTRQTVIQTLQTDSTGIHPQVLDTEATETTEKQADTISESQHTETVADSIPIVVQDNRITEYNSWVRREVKFNPDPTRAVWMSALFPGLGQIYNRRYWKLPIVIGAYVGLGYGCSWNNSMLSDYTRAYRDIMDNDPSTKSYMDLFPSTTREEDLNKTWLSNVLRTRKDYYRRNRDLCIICMIGVYLIAMVDAYVDASLSHFDISPDLAMDIAPAIMQESRSARPAIGLSWAITF